MPPTTFKEKYKALSLIYFTLVLIPTAFIGVTYYLVSTLQIDIDAPDLASVFKYVVYLLTPVSVGAGYFIYKKQLAQIDPGISLGSKFNMLQAAILIRTACLEAPALFAVVCTMKTGQLELLAVAGVLVVIMAFLRPTMESIRKDLQLSTADAARLADPEAVIE